MRIKKDQKYLFEYIVQELLIETSEISPVLLMLILEISDLEIYFAQFISHLTTLQFYSAFKYKNKKRITIVNSNSDVYTKYPEDIKNKYKISSIENINTFTNMKRCSHFWDNKL